MKPRKSKNRERKNQRNRQAFASGLACVLSAGILLVGTFAWRSISQTAVNEMDRSVTVGGRLHDDFDGTNKDVYAENYMSKNEGGLPIYVRIRLDEYMEIGQDAGENRKSADRAATPIVEGTDINDVTTWVTHIPQDANATLCQGDSSVFHEYYTWTMGGRKYYLPTFNKNADSLKADINGTYEKNYEDYVDYSKIDGIYGTAIYDADTNDVDEGNVITKEEYRTKTMTQDAVVMTMQQWKQKYNCQPGKYWVYDTDGWAYWAEALEPGQATGLLLDSVELTAEISENCYYAINVVAQFATADDWGSKDNPVGFFEGYDPDNGVTGPTEDALFLLYQAAGLDYDVNVQTMSRSGQVQPGDTVVFISEVTCMDRVVNNQNVVWSLKGAASEDTTISADGVLTVAEDETAEALLVTAKYSKKVMSDVLVKVTH